MFSELGMRRSGTGRDTVANELGVPWRVNSVEVVNCSTAGLAGCRCSSVVLAFRHETKWRWYTEMKMFL